MGAAVEVNVPRTGDGRAREWAERLVPVTSDVKISWNGATRETQERIMHTLTTGKPLRN